MANGDYDGDNGYNKGDESGGCTGDDVHRCCGVSVNGRCMISFSHSLLQHKDVRIRVVDVVQALAPHIQCSTRHLHAEETAPTSVGDKRNAQRQQKRDEGEEEPINVERLTRHMELLSPSSTFYELSIHLGVESATKICYHLLCNNREREARR